MMRDKKQKNKFAYTIFSYTSATPKQLYSDKTKAQKWVEKEVSRKGTYRDEFKIIRLKVV